MNDHDKVPDQAQRDEYTRELARLLNLLETVDRQITPEHVAQRFRELLDNLGDDGPPVPPAPPGRMVAMGDPMHPDGPALTFMPTGWQAFVRAAQQGHFGQSEVALLADAALREAVTARADARRHVEDARRVAGDMKDSALKKAALIEREARQKAARIEAEAREKAAVILNAAAKTADRIEATARTEAEEIKSAAQAQADASPEGPLRGEIFMHNAHTGAEVVHWVGADPPGGFLNTELDTTVAQFFRDQATIPPILDRLTAIEKVRNLVVDGDRRIWAWRVGEEGKDSSVGAVAAWHSYGSGRVFVALRALLQSTDLALPGPGEQWPEQALDYLISAQRNLIRLVMDGMPGRPPRPADPFLPAAFRDLPSVVRAPHPAAALIAPQSELPVLPPYLLQDRGAALAAAVKAAGSGTSVIAALAGGSSSGKTHVVTALADALVNHAHPLEQMERMATAAAKELASASARDIIAWAIETFGDRFCIISSMTDAVIIHLAASVKPGIDVIFLDTGYHFSETLGTRDAVAATYPINLINVTPARMVGEQDGELGPRLYGRNPDLCCYLRKVVPLERALDPYDALITGARRTEDDAQGSIQVVEWDARRAVVRVNPVAGWTQEQVDSYIAENGVLVNPLVDEGYPSIGCATCTMPNMKPGVDPRSDTSADTTKSDRSGGHALTARR